MTPDVEAAKRETAAAQARVSAARAKVREVEGTLAAMTATLVGAKADVQHAVFASYAASLREDRIIASAKRAMQAAEYRSMDTNAILKRSFAGPEREESRRYADAYAAAFGKLDG